MTEKKIQCPVCRKDTVWEGNPFRPFCSERCSLIDLGKWADEKYSVEVEQGREEAEGEKEKGNE